MTAMHRIPYVLLALFSMASLESLAAEALGIVPARPVAGEPFVLVYNGEARTPLNGYFNLQSTVTASGANLLLSTDVDAPIGVRAPCFGCEYTNRYQTFASATVVAPGTYALSRSIRDKQGLLQEVVSNLVVDPPRAAATPQFRNLSGNYFAADENGAGVNVIQSADGQLFVVWATYGSGPYVQNSNYSPDVEATWLVISNGKWISPTEFQGVMYTTIGGPYASPWDASKFYASPFGVMNLRFTDRNLVDMDAQFAYNGARKQKRLSRLPF
ncbi:hypothetical protein BWI17_17100 [Betaproteobacteria bacterium GR16-43]|nr:hypothetical protein BWI17_17100 [Betaproteobacteria bacterium GR16-43]